MAQPKTNVFVDQVTQVQVFNISTNALLGSFNKLQRVSFNVSVNQQAVHGGNSGYPIYMLDGDKDSKITLEGVTLSLGLLQLLSGGTFTSGSTTVPNTETITIAATVTLAQTPVALSDAVYYKADLTPLTRVALTPTAGQYSISGSTLTFEATDVGKEAIVVYDYTATAGETIAILNSSKSTPFKLIAHATVKQDDASTTDVPIRIVAYKCQLVGSFNLDFQRKQASTQTAELTLLDAGRTDRHVLDVIAVPPA